MSQFLDQIDSFSKQYSISKFDRLKLHLHYPLFKIYWLTQHGGGLVKNLAQSIYKLFINHSINIVAYSKDRKKLSIPISFDQCDLASFKEIFWGEEYGETSSIPDIKTVFDIGANTGMASLYFLANTNLKKLIAVEANPVLADKLKGTLLDDRVIIENIAIFGEPGSLSFKIADDHRESIICDEKEKGPGIIKIESVLLEDLLRKHSLESADLLKMDIEGAEYSIIEKTPESFKRFKYIYMEIHGDVPTRNKFSSKILELGFNLEKRIGAEHENCEICFFKAKH